jgi:hypothetical protein
MPIMRLSVPYDLAMLRFGTAGLLLLPGLLRNGLALDHLRWWQRSSQTDSGHEMP